MAEKYIPQQIEKKWQERWEAEGLYATREDPRKEKFYFLTMLPYPSGDLHIGHWYAMTPSDAAARYKRMRGYNVFFPIGFDAFGLNAENAAIKNQTHPWIWTHANIERMRKQLRSMGAMWALDREAVSCDPRYYKWTQWFFLKLYEMGLAYKQFAPVDFCPKDNTTLAREQVWGEDRHCERCGTPVIKKNLDQWFFRITKSAEELLDFTQIDWPERVRVMQTNWIGRSEGAEVDFRTEVGNHPLRVFTTRPDTLWGATFMVIAPEHPLVEELTTPAQRAQVETYVAQTRRQSDIEREAVDKEKTGVFIGTYAINPVNDERIPIWIADYVLMTYGTGAIMAVPAHDQRDFEFARKFNLPIRVVIQPAGETLDPTTMPESYPGEGVLVHSGPFNGTIAGISPKMAMERLEGTSQGKNAVSYPSSASTYYSVQEVTQWLEETGRGQRAVNYHLHDWLISRQRYWGAPIPIIYCANCGTVPVPYEDLPVLLPEDAEFLPTGESPLKFHKGFRYVKCPQCGGDAERETDTMDTFLCSSWYNYAYLTPYWKDEEPIHRDDMPWDKAKGDYWLPVDQYTGGIEHATMHLIYTRFFTKAMRDMGLVPFGEPMLRLFNQGLILGEDNEKMSKSRGNVVAPDDLVERYGADAVRAYLMFIGPWELGGPWSSQGIEGVQRFLNRVWTLVTDEAETRRNGQPPAGDARALRRVTHQTIQKVTQDIEHFRFNTMIASLMEFNNALLKAKDTAVYGTPAWDEAVDSLLLLMAPSMPHVSEELWQRRHPGPSVHMQRWPEYDAEAAKEETVTLIVQVNGKIRDKVNVPANIGEEEAKAAALATAGAQRYIEGKPVRKVIYVGGKLVNFVV
ncbi:MAG: leucine--tRNA ligase [Anaerolineae bacterium]|nr:leucine--tRNA ligase [Anaerolineae bacterium]